MHAIDLAIKLSKDRKYKQAIDVLQHAYDAGRSEGNNPSNFSKIQDMVVELRRKYYEVFKPRFFQDNAVTKDEMELLRKSGQTKTILLPIWDDVGEGYAAENVYLPCKGENWEDAFAPYISPKQKSSGCVLARFPKIVSVPESLKVYYEADPMNIKQTVVGDCSLVSSLIICTNFQKRFPQYNLITSVVFPQDENGAPMVSPKGKYCVKMLVNGITRMVVVDDRIPVSKTMKTPPPPSPTTASPPAPLPALPPAGGASTATTNAVASPTGGCRFLFQPLCTYSRNPSEMWVSIIEKAFVKVCGGSYDFPGSNSSVDMFKLSGWLPDGYYFDGEGIDLEVQWKRLLVSHGRGALLATISTPQNLSKDVEEKLKLVPGHAYAVIGVVEEEGGARRLLKIKNPWARQSWEGLYSFRDTNWPAELKERLAFTEAEANQGVFWMSWADVCRYFRRCNLSWNPYLLFQPIADNTPKRPRRIAGHGVLTFAECYAECPQYHVMARQLSKPTRLHVVLARHVLDLVKEYEQRADTADDDSPLITVHVYDVTNSPTVAQLSAGRQGTYLPNCEGDRCMARLISNGGELLGGEDACTIHKGVYKNVEAQTISFTCPPGDRDLILIVAQHQGKRDSKFPFSLFLHTDIAAAAPAGGNTPSLTMHQCPPFKPLVDDKSGSAIRSLVAGEWKSGQSCGGKSDAQTFVFNPQYVLTLSAPSHLTIRLNAGANKEAVNIQVVKRRPPPQGKATVPDVPWSHRIDRIHPVSCDIVLQSPMFFHSGAIMDTALQACLAFDATSTLKPQAPQAPAAAAPPATPAAPPPPPPQRWVGPLVVNVPKSATAKSFEIPCVFPNLPAASVVLVGALAQSMLVAPDISKVIHSGSVLTAAPSPPVQAFPLADAFVLLANTEDLQRTQPLQAVVVELYEAARCLLKAQHGAAAATPIGEAIPVALQKEVQRINEVMSQLLGKLDAVSCPTDDIRAARRAVILACQEVHTLADALLLIMASPPPPTLTSPTQNTSTPVAAVEHVAPLNMLPAGTYTVVVSAWKKSSPSPFTLCVESTATHTITEIPPEGAGYRSQIIQTQLRGVSPPPAEVLTVPVPGSGRQVMLPVTHQLFSSQPCLTIATGKTPCIFTARIVTVEANPQQGPSTVPIAAAVFSVTGTSDSTATRVAQLMFVSSFTSNSVMVEPMTLLPQHQYIMMLLSAEVSSLPLVVRCYGSSEYSAKVNN